MTALPEEAIAIVGMAGRFPGAVVVPEFWANTLSGKAFVNRRTDASGAVLWARAELADIAAFDPAFFGMSPRDALLLDPQHRILLECAWEALADAAVDGREPVRRTAVFAGANYSGYRELLGRIGGQVNAVEFDSGVDKDFLATTIAYRLGLQGPSMTVQTACSSSLVAVHLASQALLEFDADQALAGGVSIVLPHTPGGWFQPRGIHSADGVCRPFDAAANGTVMGDGAGIVVLRRLEDAIADGCRVYAVLRATAVNNDGSRKIGYAAPSVLGQAEVIRAARNRAGVDPAGIGYIETHGAGTPLGDRVEFQALLEASGPGGTGGGRCALGSVKGAIGHLDIAAGVTGLIRATLALHHATIPGTVNHEQAHPDLAMDDTPFYVPRAPVPWHHGSPRRAGVSSFGIGGTNAHVIVEECTPAAGRGVGERPTLVGAGYAARRYWPAEHPAASEACAPVTAAGMPVEYRRATWREWLPGGGQAPDRPDYGRIVLLDGADTTGDGLYELLRSRATAVIRVGEAGTVGDGSPNLVEVLRRTATPERALVVCAWSVAGGDRTRRCYDALTTVAAAWLDRDRPAGGLDVVLLTRGMYAVTDDEPGDPAMAALTGLARVISMEAPALRIRVLDVVDAAGPALADVADAVLTWQDEPVLVRRGRRWWHRVFEPTALPANRPAGDRTGAGVSVVIGAGQVGAAAARVLARAGGTVVLAARPGIGTERARILGRELDSATTTTVVECCDAADPAQIEALLARLAARFGVLDQVILAAGKSGDAAYQPSRDLPLWQHEEHFRIKVDGVAALAGAARRYAVGRVVLMSSLAGVLGAISLGPYAAAAAVLDCSAERFDEPRGGWLSLGWDAWQHDTTTASAHESRMVQDGLTAAEAEKALSDLLLSDVTGHILVVKGDFAGRWDRFVRQPLRQAVTASPELTTEPPEASDLPRMVLDAWQACLEVPDLDLDDDLLAHGADSLNAIGVLVELGEQLKVSLPTDLIFEVRTPRLLAAHIGALPAWAGRPTVRRWRGTGALIWCLHPISGSADGFEALADRLAEYQIRAVSGQPLAEVDHHESIDRQAVRYHEALAESGGPPEALVGWSYGGILAFELAQHVFRTSGRRPLVIVLDIPAPPGAGPRRIDHAGDAEILMAIMEHRMRESGEQVAVDFGRLLRSEMRDEGGAVLAHLLDQFRAQGVVPPGFTVGTAGHLTSGYRHRMRAVEQYQPLPYSGRVTLVRATEAEFGDTGILDGVLAAPAHDASWGWSALARDGFSVEILDGHHATLLQPPAVEAVARIVRQAMSHTTEV